VGSAFSVELTALIVLALLVLVMRWVFGGKRRYRRVPIDAAQSDELGLLTVVATSLDRDAAMRTRARLGEADIRSSMSRRRDGRFDVLVFDADLEQARTLLR
jgi:hypothetical protein